MADLVRLAYYPFLPEVRDAVREAGADLGEVLTSPLYAGARARAAERVEGALEGGFPPARITDERAALLELLSVPVARMLCVAAGDKVLIQRYAGAEGRRVHDTLAADQDAGALETCAGALGVKIEAGAGGYRMHFSEYLRCAPLQDTQWKLIRRPVGKGNLVLDRPDAVRLVQEALQRRIIEELEAERAKPMAEPMKAGLKPMLDRLGPKLEAARESWTTGDFGPVQPGLFPPCIKEIFESLKRNENVPHHGRFAFATFLNTIGWNAEQILDYLSTTPNFDRDKSRYQIEHVTGQKSVGAYTPPGCGTMQTNGVCPLDKRDGLCFKIKHPLSYYRAKIRFQEQDKAKAEAVPPAQPMAKPVAAAQTTVKP